MNTAQNAERTPNPCSSVARRPHPPPPLQHPRTRTIHTLHTLHIITITKTRAKHHQYQQIPTNVTRILSIPTKQLQTPPKCPQKARNHTLFSRSHCTPRVRVGATSSKGPLIYPSSATFCAHFGPCVGDLHPPHFARFFEPDHRPPHFRRKFKPMRAPGEAAANSPTGGGVRAVRCDSHVSDAMGEMTSCGRRSVGPGR